MHLLVRDDFYRQVLKQNLQAQKHYPLVFLPADIY
jgi:hypothetical protein